MDQESSKQKITNDTSQRCIFIFRRGSGYQWRASGFGVGAAVVHDICKWLARMT